jgi:ferredoxin-NADP reductase
VFTKVTKNKIQQEKMFFAKLFHKKNTSPKSLTTSSSTRPTQQELRVAKFGESFRFASKQRKRQGHVERLSYITPSVIELVIHLPESEANGFTFHPGQWVSVFSGHPEFTDRAEFSIASTPELFYTSNTIILMVKIPEDKQRISTGNPVVRYLSQAAKQNDPIQIKGPGGNSYYSDNLSEIPIVLIGGGTGIAPMLSILRHICNSYDKQYNSDKPTVTLVISVRSLLDIPYSKELTSIVQHHNNITIQFTFSSEEPAKLSPTISIAITKSSGGTDTIDIDTMNLWNGWTGRLDESKLSSLDINFESSVFFLCGPPAMVDSIDKSLTLKGANPEQILYDKWW